MKDEDIAWDELEGAYRTPYDPRPALAAAARGTASWDILWEELHHQGDVGTASYAAVPIIARIAGEATNVSHEPFALAAIIEQCRSETWNPEMPAWLKKDYSAAWDSLSRSAHRHLPDAQDDALISALMAVIAIRLGQPWLGRLALRFTETERRELLEQAGLA